MLALSLSLSSAMRSWCGALEFGASFLSGLLALRHSGLLALLPAWVGVLVGPGDAGPPRGLHSTWREAYF